MRPALFIPSLTSMSTSSSTLACQCILSRTDLYDFTRWLLECWTWRVTPCWTLRSAIASSRAMWSIICFRVCLTTCVCRWDHSFGNTSTAMVCPIKSQITWKGFLPSPGDTMSTWWRHRLLQSLLAFNKMTVGVLQNGAWHCGTTPDSKGPWIDMDCTSIRHESIGSMSNWRRSIGLCYTAATRVFWLQSVTYICIKLPHLTWRLDTSFVRYLIFRAVNVTHLASSTSRYTYYHPIFRYVVAVTYPSISGCERTAYFLSIVRQVLSNEWRHYMCHISWASYQILNILGCAYAGNAGNDFPAIDFKGNR